MLSRLNKLIKGEIALGFYLATIFWIGVLGWATSYVPTDFEKQECQKAAQNSSRKTEECKTLWERTTSDPVALFAFGTFVFTGVLAISTGFLWRSTHHAAIAAQAAAEHIPRVERAYISGGAGFRLDRLRPQGTYDRHTIFAVMNNYGKTPAFIGTVAVASCRESQLSYLAQWDMQEWKGYVLGPDTHSHVSDVGLSYIKGLVMVGRIWYRDIFNECHSCGFALHMEEGLPAVRGHDAYWEDREETDLGPAA